MSLSLPALYALIVPMLTKALKNAFLAFHRISTDDLPSVLQGCSWQRALIRPSLRELRSGIASVNVVTMWTDLQHAAGPGGKEAAALLLLLAMPVAVQSKLDSFDASANAEGKPGIRRLITTDPSGKSLCHQLVMSINAAGAEEDTVVA